MIVMYHWPFDFTSFVCTWNLLGFVYSFVCLLEFCRTFPKSYLQHFIEREVNNCISGRLPYVVVDGHT